MLSRLLPLFFGALLLLGGCSTAPPATPRGAQGSYDYTRAYLAWMIDREMSRNDITGVSIALVDNQQIVWQKGFGYADLENNIPATPETVYRAGSIAKLFTAAATMQLAEQGKLNIDSPLSAALPGFSIKSRFPTSAPITPRNIMCHHSGLPSNFLQGLFVRNPGRFDTVVESIRDEHQAFPANYVFSYSNLGMALLGAAIQNVSGEPFDSYMENHFFRPLGMNQTSFSQRPITKVYDRNKEAEVFSMRDMPAANLLSSVVDLAQFMKMQFSDGVVAEKRLLGASSLREMMRIQNKDFPLTFGQYVGLGWMMSGIDVPGGGPVASHGGSLPDSHSMLAILPDYKLGVVVLTNSATSHVAVSKIATAALRLMLEAKTGIRHEESAPVRAAERKPSENELRSFSGYFDSMVGLARISTDSGQIDVEAAGHQFRLVPHEDGLMTIRYKVLGMLPVRVGAFEDIHLSMVNADGRQIIVGRMGSESMIFGEKINPAKAPERFLKSLGDYEIVSKMDGPMPDKLLLREDNGLLIGEAHFPEVPDLLLRIAFSPVSDHEVVTAGLGTSRGDTLRVIESGNEAILSFSGMQLRKKPN